MNRRLLAVIAALVASILPAPAAADPPRPEISAAELSNLVKTGGEITGRTVPAAALVAAMAETGDPVAAKRTITIVDSDVTGFLDGARKVYTHPCVFRNVTFDGRVDFTGSSFGGALTFAGKTRFTKEVTLNEAVFHTPTTFEEGTVFEDRFEAFRGNFAEARFDKAVFKRRASFSEATFRGPASFVGSRFETGTSWSTYSQLFERTIFQDTVDFAKAELGGTALFDRAIFARDVSFAGAKLESIHFEDTTFTGKALFSGASLTGTATFKHIMFSAEVQLDSLNEGRPDGDRSDDLVLTEVRALGRSYFGASTLKSVSFTRTLDPKSQRPGVPSVFDRPVHLELLRCDTADFTAAEFRDLANFTGASFRRFVSFRHATFGGDTSFGGASFPDAAGGTEREPRGLDLAGTKFEKKVMLRYDQLVEQSPWYRIWAAPRAKLVAPDAVTWATLEQAFLAAGDLRSRGEAVRQRELLSSPGRGGSLANKASLVLWGHGSQPGRLFAWIVVFNAIFAALYWTQTRSLAAGLAPLDGWIARLRFTAALTARTAVWPSLGSQAGRTPAFKALLAIQSIGSKVLLLLLLRAAVNVSPLLDDLVGKLLPG